MRTSDAIAHIIERSGKSRSAISIELRKSRNFITSSFSQSGGDWSPQADTLAAIARACGYSLVLEGSGERIVID